MSLKIKVQCDYAWPGKFHTCGAALTLWAATDDLAQPLAAMLAVQGWTAKEKITPGGRRLETFCVQHPYGEAGRGGRVVGGTPTFKMVPGVVHPAFPEPPTSTAANEWAEQEQARTPSPALATPWVKDPLRNLLHDPKCLVITRSFGLDRCTCPGGPLPVDDDDIKPFRATRDSGGRPGTPPAGGH